MQILNSDEELKSTKMWQYLLSIDPLYANAVIQFVNNITPILASIKEIFPFYTRHDAHHGFRVLLRMEQIVSNECFKATSAIAFKPDEALLLICAAYAHDLGMAVFPGEESNLCRELGILFDEHWKASTVLQDHLREKHSERGGLYIAKNTDQLAIPKNLVFLLHKLMEAHNLSVNELDIQLGKRFSAGNEEINLKQLACILCISDAIEFSETRVVEGVLDTLIEKMKSSNDAALILSYRHNMQSVCIGNGVAVAEDGKIIFTGTFTDPDIMSLADNTIDLIENWTRSYIDIDFQSKKKRLVIRADSVIRQLNIVGYDYERIGIRMKKENIIDLISSNATWTNDAAIVLREILQNSVEACRYRQHHSPNYYIPKIDIYVNSTERTIEITDNGCGMSRNIILNNFLTIGNSRSFEPSYSTFQYSSLARFGIGFWSVFTIAEKAIIITAPFEYLNSESITVGKVNGVEFEVSIKEVKDFTVFRPLSVSPGTTIKLFLKESFNIVEMIYRISYHIGCSEIPIEIHHAEGKIVIPQKMKLPTMSEIFGSKSNAIADLNILEFIYDARVDEIDIQLKFLYTKSGNDIHFTFPDTRQSLLGLQDRNINVKFRGVGVCGFLFNHLAGTALLDFHRIGYLCANALNPKGFIFSLNRLGVMDSPKFSHFKDVLTDQIHNGYRKLLKENSSLNAKTISILNQESRASGGELQGLFTSNSLKDMLVKNSDLIAFKLYKIEEGKSINDCEVSYLYYSELIREEYVLWLYSAPYHHLNFRISEQNNGIVYELIKKRCNLSNLNFLLECTREAEMISDNANNLVVDANIKLYSNFAPLPIRIFSAKDIEPGKSESLVIGNIRGVWAGTISERKIEGANFVFLSHNHCIISTGCELALNIKSLLSAGNNFQVAELINMLLDSTQGHINELVQKYF